MTISERDEWNDPGSSDRDVASWALRQLDDCPCVSKLISSLVLGHTPRRVETHIEHVRVLADVIERLPPILVHGPSGKVIDGAHRVRAALLRSENTIRARIYSGSLDDAFVLAVNLNSNHGLPLSRPERTAAANRILRSHAQWSDRMVAGITGLAAGTIRNLRQESTAPGPLPMTRVGKDGRARPLITLLVGCAPASCWSIGRMPRIAR